MSILNLPNQRITSAKRNSDWWKNSINAIINNSSFMGNVNNGSIDFVKLKSYYNGEIDKKDYNYVTNPYNNKKFADRFPAKIRNYNIIKPVVDLLVGEKTRRPRNFQVVCLNPDSVDAFKQKRFEEALKNIKQSFINELNSLGFNTGVPTQEVEPLPDLLKRFNSTYKDARAIIGEDIYDYLNWYLNLDEKFLDAFKNWLVYGTVVSFKQSKYDDVDMEIIPPYEVDFDRSPNLKYIEDGAWVVRRTVKSVHEIIDEYADELSEEDIDRLQFPEKYAEDGIYSSGFNLEFIEGDLNINFTDNDRMINVYHTVWKSFKKVGKLTYLNEIGKKETIYVDENYKFSEEDGDLDIKWFWINEILHGKRIGRDIFVSMEPFPVQRTSLTNPSKCKLPYNGIKNSTSIVKQGIPYQLLYNIFHYRLELSIAKNKDKIALMEINTIPKKKGWDEDKFMYLSDAVGFAFVDSTAENADGEKPIFNSWQVLDMSLSNYISKQFELLIAIKDEWEESLGISRQRKGNIMASDGRGTTDRAIYQSATITEEIFKRFDYFEFKDISGLIDTGLHAYRKGKKASYVLGDGAVKILDLDYEDTVGIDLDVVPINSTNSYENLQILRSLSRELVQNGMEASTLAELLESTSMSKLKSKLKEVEEARKQWEIEQNKMKQEEADAKLKQSLAIEKEAREDKQAHESIENQLNREKDLLIKQMDVDVKMQKITTDAEKAQQELNQDRIALEKEYSLKINQELNSNSNNKK